MEGRTPSNPLKVFRGKGAALCVESAAFSIIIAAFRGKSVASSSLSAPLPLFLLLLHLLLSFSGFRRRARARALPEELANAGFTAAVAGLKAGDRITGLNGQAVSELDALADAVGKLKAGDKLAIKFVRGGDEKETAVVGGSAEGEAKLVTDAPKEEKKEENAGKR